mmetsp:Transcript_30535/g.54595  ORF Transcript_30535/g.54595 Transcript_30535/m.54595 type:complete len:1272 (-) Transcript_30535:403-4218(-)
MTGSLDPADAEKLEGSTPAAVAEVEVKAKEVRIKVSIFKMFSMASGNELLIFFAGLVGACFHGLSQPLLCLLFGDLIDGIGGDSDPDNMMKLMADLCMKMALVGCGTIVSATLQGACFKTFSELQVMKLRVLYFDTVLHQDVSWFDTQEVAALPSQINEDMEKIAEAFGDKMGSGIMAFSAFAGGFTCAFLLGWQIALVMCAIFPFLGVGAMLMGKAVQEVQLETQSWYAKAAAVVEECLYSIRTVVAFGGEKRELEKFRVAVVEARRGGIKNGFKIGAGMGYNMSIIFAGYALAFWYGMTLRHNDSLNPATGEVWLPGRILAIFFCVFIGSFMVGNIDPSVKAFTAGRYAAGRFFSVLDRQTSIQCRGSDLRKEIQSIESMELRDVHFCYPARPGVKVLNGLSLVVKRGQKIAVVGESGSGKSTVMSLLERFYDADSGSVLVNGEDIRDFSVASLRSNIGYVGQEPVLFATSIRENIMQGCPNATQADFDQACNDAILTFVEALPLKYDTFVGSGGSQFSGGQKQRMAIARALLKKASLLFLDEATSALDNTSEKMIQATIEHIGTSSTTGLGIVSIAHRLSTVRGCDLIYVLSRGTLVEQGTHLQLMEKKGAYYALAASQDSAAAEVSISAVKPSAKEEAPTERRANEGDGTTKSGKTSADSLADAQGTAAKKQSDREKEVAKTYKVPMGRLLGFNKPEWPVFVPAILAALVDGASMPVVAILLVESMDSFYKPKEEMKEDLEWLSIYFCIVGVANFFAGTVENGCFAVLGEAMTQRIRVAILTSIFRQEIGFHDDPENTPGMLNKALELYAYRVSTLCKSIGNKAASMSALVVGLSIAFASCWQMSLVMLGSIPVMIAGNALQMIVMLGATKADNEELKHAQQVISDSVQNARTVQALGNEKELVELYAAMVRKTAIGLPQRNVLAGFAFGLASAVMFFVMAGGFYFASFLIQSGEAKFSDVMKAFMGIFYAGLGAGQAASMMGDATKAKVAAHDMFKLLDRRSKIEGLEPMGETPVEIEAGLIEFRDVHFHYPFRPQVQVLKGVSFTIQPGQAVGLVGPSGGGKSTVMALIQRFYDPMQGTVLIGHQKKPLNELNIRFWRRQVGFVGQEPVLFNTTVRENIMYGLDDGETISTERLEECQQMANLGFLFKDGNKGLDTEVGPRGNRLSGGQKQRVAICRALVRNPSVLLLDEATSALDTQSEKVVQDALEAARKGRTSFAIAHRLSTISGSDIILVVSEGFVVEKGTHDELMKLEGVYHKLQMQSQH